MWRNWTLAVALACAGAAQAQQVQVERAGYALEAQARGEGGVAVVFESGFGQDAGAWQHVVARLGTGCRCIVYSRAGLGKSGTDGAPKSIDAHLQDLGAVLDALAPGAKVVLVGHSYGGLLVTEFARRYPRRVQGLVLVDPATVGQRHDFLHADRERVLADDAALLAMLPPHLAADYRMLIAQLDADPAPAPRPLPAIPVALLTATNFAAKPFVLEETAQGKAMWKRQHAALFAGVARGTHRYFATGHNIHREQPDAVADAIREIVVESQAP